MKKIWIDLDNTPHVPFFRPIIDELGKRGYECFITARDAYQVLDLADQFGLKYQKIGRHYGKNKILKVLGTTARSLEMIFTVKKQKPVLAVSHGSRSQLLAAHLLNIPSLVLIDYEYAKGLKAIRPTYIMTPEVIQNSATRHATSIFLKYPGIKEDVYVPRFIPDPSLKTDIGMNDQALIITIRPPATEAHYFTPLSQELFERAMSWLLEKPDTQLILLPRNKRQEDVIRRTWPAALDTGKILIPDHAVNGLDLMWFSDLVISGGGTMNREAAALGVPVYSIFRGTTGAVDQFLSQNGRLIMIESANDLQDKIRLVKRNKDVALMSQGTAALNSIVDRIDEIITYKKPKIV